jgi:hypothetical protein
MPWHRHVTTTFAVGAIASTLALGGCGGIDGVDLNGKIFDWMGVSSASQVKSEPNMADRAPLVVPPNVTRLPEPGTGKTSSEDVAALNDPELRKQAAAKERERLHQAYCRGEIQWKDKAYKPQDTGANKSPYGSCGLFGAANINK